MLSACVAPSRGPETATPGAGGTTHCGQFENVSVADNQYVVQTNEWNSTQTQCVRVTATGFAVTEANFGLPTAGPPASYPSIFKGCHWGNCTNGSGMPVQVASLPAVKSGWTVVAPESGAYDIAYDLWFNQTPTTSGQPNGTELMIWIRHAGGVRPAGSQVGTVSLAGAAWDVWKGKMPSWTYVAYVRQAAADAVDLDLRAFVEDAVARGTIDPSWYMVDIEAGFEIWQGGRGLATSSFSAVVGGPSRI
jgi:hypothetical protein